MTSHNAPLLMIGGIAGTLALSALTVRNRKRLENRDKEGGDWLEAAPRREAAKNRGQRGAKTGG